MAKDKKDEAASAGEDGKRRKAAKQLRKAGDAAVKLAQQPVVSELVAAALTAAAASLSQTRAAKNAARQASDAAEGAARETAAISQAVKRALVDAARSLLDEFDDSPREKTLSRSEPEEPRKSAGKAGKKGKGSATTSSR